MMGFEPIPRFHGNGFQVRCVCHFATSAASTAEKCSHENRLRQNESPSSPRRVFDRTGIKIKAVKGRLAVTIFLNKSANFFLQRPYLPLEQRITRGCFPPSERHRFMCRSLAFRRNPARPPSAAGCVVLL